MGKIHLNATILVPASHMAQMVFMKTFSHRNTSGAIAVFQRTSRAEFSWRRPPPPRCSPHVKPGHVVPALLEKMTGTYTEEGKSGGRGQRSRLKAKDCAAHETNEERAFLAALTLSISLVQRLGSSHTITCVQTDVTLYSSPPPEGEKDTGTEFPFKDLFKLFNLTTNNRFLCLAA